MGEIQTDVVKQAPKVKIQSLGRMLAVRFGIQFSDGLLEGIESCKQRLKTKVLSILVMVGLAISNSASSKLTIFQFASIFELCLSQCIKNIKHLAPDLLNIQDISPPVDLLLNLQNAIPIHVLMLYVV